jgi:hypothetical protein
MLSIGRLGIRAIQPLILLEVKGEESMKIMVKLAVLFAILLLVTGVAFATACSDLACYSVNGVAVDNPANNFTGQIWQICFSGTPATVEIIPPAPPLFDPTFIALFTDGLGLQAIGSGGVPAAFPIYLKFHGSDNDIFNGILSPEAMTKYRVHGIRVQCPPPV